MAQGENIIWVGHDQTKVDAFLHQLKSLSYQVFFHTNFDEVAFHEECDVLIISMEGDHAEIIDQCLKYKHQFSKHQCKSILISASYRLEDKERYFRSGGNYLISEPFGSDELLSIINQNKVAY